MVILKLILSGILAITVFISMAFGQHSNKLWIKILMVVIGIISLIFGCIIFASIIDDTEKPITPLDVYRGKTQLVLDYNTDGTYDSIVVWKGDKK